MIDISYFQDYASSHQLPRSLGQSSGQSLGNCRFLLAYNESITLIESADYSSALQCLENAIALEPMNDEVWALQGVVLVYLGRYEEAIASCDRALEINPTYAEAWKFRGLALHGLNRYREAHISYARALGDIHYSPLRNLTHWIHNFFGTTETYDYPTTVL